MGGEERVARIVKSQGGYERKVKRKEKREERSVNMKMAESGFKDESWECGIID